MYGDGISIAGTMLVEEGIDEEFEMMLTPVTFEIKGKVREARRLASIT